MTGKTVAKGKVCTVLYDSEKGTYTLTGLLGKQIEIPKSFADDLGLTPQELAYRGDALTEKVNEEVQKKSGNFKERWELEIEKNQQQRKYSGRILFKGDEEK